MQLLWVGCWESAEEFERKARKGYNLAAPQVSQAGLINGIECLTHLAMDSINGSVLPPYPVYEDRFVEPVVWSHIEGAYDISVGYKNDKYINRLNCKNAMLAAAKGWVKERYQGGDLTVMVYSMRSAPMATACYIKQQIPNAKIYLIVTDLPQYMDLGQSKLKAFLKKLDWHSIQKMQQKFDGFILYAAKMAEFLKIPDGKWLLMEGSYDCNIAPVAAENKCKAIMYSGKLDMQYGIDLLLDAFMELPDQDAELWLTGGGNAESYIRECADKDPRIKFYGFLPSREDVLKLQQKASLLVNMRLPSEPASAYCFPSKLFEYMASGIPVLTFKLKGIPSEYYDKLLIVKEESPKELCAMIKNGLSISNDERERMGAEARAFVLNQKTSLAQSERVLSFIEQ